MCKIYSLGLLVNISRKICISDSADLFLYTEQLQEVKKTRAIKASFYS